MAGATQDAKVAESSRSTERANCCRMQKRADVDFERG